MTFVCDLWGVWAGASEAPDLCEIVCETCCGAPEGARAVSSCHQVLPRTERRMGSDFSSGPFLLGPQPEVQAAWLSPFSHGHGRSILTPPCLLQPAAKGGNMGTRRVPSPRMQAPGNPCPRGSGLPRSSLGHCGQHLIPTERFSSLRPAGEGSGQLNLPTACPTSWPQLAGDSFPQGQCQQLSWGTGRVLVQAGWPDILGASDSLCRWGPHLGRLWGKQ